MKESERLVPWLQGLGHRPDHPLQLCRSQALHTKVLKPWSRVCLTLSRRPNDLTNVLQKAIYPTNCYRSAMADEAGAGLKSRRIIGRLKRRYSLDRAEHVDTGRLEELPFHRA